LATNELISANPSAALSDSESLRVRGARTHNLKSVSVDIPHNEITVVTGVSGSGKSSLAFDTIYAEGQRRYVESLSAYARQFLERMEKPDVDDISGIAPAVAIRQKNTTRNPRSTVATATEIYDYLRLLYARCGQTFCIKCGAEVKRDSPDEIADRVFALPAGQRFYVLYELVIAQPQAPAPSKRPPRKKLPELPKDVLRATLLDLQRRGFNRLVQAGKVHEFSSPETLLDVDFAKPVHVLVDRLSVSPESRSRLIDGIEICYRESRGEAILEFLPDAASPASPTPHRLVFNERFECKNDGTVYQVPEPRLFSFNNPYGACPRCQGFGNTIDFDLNLVVPDPSKSLDEGAIEPWTKPRFRTIVIELKKWARARGIPTNVPWRQLTAEHRRLVLEGDPENDFDGVKGFFAWLERKKYKLHVRVFLSRYRGYATCPDCSGTRLRAEARAVRVANKPITEVCKLTVKEARVFFSTLQLTEMQKAVADKIFEEVRSRLQFLDEVGLDYLALDRLTSTLSGGESQRIQLATSLGSHLVGALYVLDEPSIGLHPRDTQRLIDILRSLRDLGNTVLVVEHDPDTIKAAGHIIDLGPGAGELGGKLLFAGAYADMLHDQKSLTGKYLSGELRIPVPNVRHKPSGKFLRIFGAAMHNLKNVDLMIPLNTFTVVTGVSGSGKSTLVHDVLFRALAAKKNNASEKEFCDRLEGDHLIKEVVIVDQSPIGRTPRSNPATYMKAFDAIREVFADTPDAKRRGYTAGHFSFNVPGGRCETCEGEGEIKVEMQFMADIYLKCESCGGKRFKQEVLEVEHKGKNIADVLDMTVEEGLEFFKDKKPVYEKILPLYDVGLGYVKLGQSSNSLSGGEAQRVKLASFLGKNSDTTGNILFIFDEPTTGLHFHDISKLLKAINALVDIGHSVIVIEHNMEVIKSADWIIDLGPEGGEKHGGHLLFAGTPEEMVKKGKGYTADFLKGKL